MKRKDAIQYANPTLEQHLENQEQMRRNNDIMNRRKEDMRLNCVIPPIIKNIYPKMKPETYELLKHDLSFLKTTTTVCENCMIEIGDSKDGHLVTRFTKTQEAFVGRGRLRPELLHERHKVP